MSTRRHARSGRLPPVTVIDVVEIDADGDLRARPASWRHAADPPPIFVATSATVKAPAIGDRLLARLHRNSDGSYDAKPMHRITEREAAPVVGRFKAAPDGRGGMIEPVERGRRTTLAVAAGATGGAKDRDLVRGEITGGRRNPQANITAILAPADHPTTISLVAIHEADIPTEFPAAALAEARAASPPQLGDRVDLRDLPLVTIDGADARDFDDAVYAAPEPTPDGGDGWHLVVAIADVAWYVHPGSALDREAYNRGNSVYFPDMVVPMLPPELSNDLCSLRPDEDRACVAAHLWIDADGNLRRHRFERALMRSAARLTYEQAQRDHDADHGAPCLAPLFAAYRALADARHRRGCLELDLPERKFEIDADGTVKSIGVVERLDSHRLIEEFMITANVAAAVTLGEHNQPALYRVHDQPDPERVEELRRALEDTGASLPRGQRLRPAAFNKVIRHTAGTPQSQLINTLILRSQAQALYSPNNTGHFGLALRDYAHFTSPIRRYADLVVHRALIAALGLADPAVSAVDLAAAGAHVSMTERRAATAERAAKDRFAAAYLADRVGATFQAHISGVTRFGLFVTLAGIGADGLVPMSRLPDRDYSLDVEASALTDHHAQRSYRLGDIHEVRLAEANALTGSLVFDLLTPPHSPPVAGRHRRRRPQDRRNPGKRRPKHRRRAN